MSNAAAGRGNDNVLAAIAAVQRECGAVAKSERNAAQGYNYASFEGYHNTLAPILLNHNLAIIESVEEVREAEHAREGAKMQHSRFVRLRVTVVHTPSGECAEYTAWGEGQNPGGKGLYAAITGARKYARACIFNLVTTDDPERDDARGAADKHGAPKASAPDSHIDDDLGI